MAVMGAPRFYLFSSWDECIYGSRTVHDDYEVMAAVLNQLDRVIGCDGAERKWLVDSSPRWQDDFLEELLLSPPVFQKTGKDGIRLIDPMGMAEDIIRERSEVAWEWRKLVSKIPEEHTDLRRLLLDRRMLDSAKAALEESVKIIDELEEIGAFE